VDNGLSCNVAYHFRLTAINQYGIGPFLAAGPFVTANAVKVVTINENSAHLEWQPASECHGAATYELQQAVASTSIVARSDAEALLNWEIVATGLHATTYSVENLLPGTPYKFRVQGSDSGKHLRSKIVSPWRSTPFVFTHSGAPAPPNIPPVVSSTEHTSAMLYIPPFCSNGERVESYRIHVQETGVDSIFPGGDSKNEDGTVLLSFSSLSPFFFPAPLIRTGLFLSILCPPSHPFLLS
jgi:hypothetical protein